MPKRKSPIEYVDYNIKRRKIEPLPCMCGYCDIGEICHIQFISRDRNPILHEIILKENNLNLEYLFNQCIVFTNILSFH